MLDYTVASTSSTRGIQGCGGMTVLTGNLQRWLVTSSEMD